tara:strand:+ start:450 stop:767 length:318 start_codon:yes stop_codon:yes gene_type:complete
MEQFNKYKFIEELKEAIGEFIEETTFKNNEDIEDEVNEFIHNHINNETIYYVDCWAICFTLASSDFEIEQTGEKAKNINELAYWSLWSVVEESIDYHLESKLLNK